MYWPAILLAKQHASKVTADSHRRNLPCQISCLTVSGAWRLWHSSPKLCVASPVKIYPGAAQGLSVVKCTPAMQPNQPLTSPETKSSFHLASSSTTSVKLLRHHYRVAMSGLHIEAAGTCRFQRPGYKRQATYGELAVSSHRGALHARVLVQLILQLQLS